MGRRGRLQSSEVAVGDVTAKKIAPSGKQKLPQNGRRISSSKQESPGEGTKLMFPLCTPLLVAVVTLACRVFYVIKPQNWWMVHPDEVYQSVEVAHMELYGYGFRTYEFSPVESVDDVTKYRRMELQQEMYAMRSPIAPYYYVLVGWMTSCAGLTVNPYLLWRIAHVVVSSVLPLAVSSYASKLYSSPDVGSIAAILVATSVHLNVFGTHCFLHSFLAPFTFFSLALFLHHRKNGDVTQKNQNGCEARPENMKLNGFSEKEMDQSDHSAQNRACDGDWHHIGNGKVSSNQFKTQLPCQTVCREDDCMKKRLLSATFLMGITSYIRPDVILIYSLNFVLFSKLRHSAHNGRKWIVLTGLSASLLVGLGSDFCYYGSGVVTPLNWVKFNVIKDLSTVIFGKMDGLMYVSDFLLHNPGTAFLLVFCLIVQAAVFIRHNTDSCSRRKTSTIPNGNSHTYDIEIKSNENIRTSTWRSLALWLLPLLVYSFNGHKELRFIHDVIVLVFVHVSVVLAGLTAVITSTKVARAVLGLTVAVFVFSQWQVFPTSDNNTKWVYQKVDGVQDVNACIRYVSSQNDVTGVFYDSNLHMTGGMTLLHHDVTIMAMMIGGFYEFGPQARKNLTYPAGLLPGKRLKSVNEFTQASNYVALANAQASVRIIIKNKAYNYLVLRRDRKFFPTGFTNVFTAGNHRVLKRSSDARSERVLQEYLENIPLGTNATVMLHEGDVLFHMGRYEEASARFQHAISLDEKLVEAYLPLAICFSKLDKSSAAAAVQEKCQTVFTKEACTTPRKITRL
ncbi:unnamed protein product [Lymnaea stagnalis]|uniref:Mannosyltransferase n=1 Tax=Lymnaea stagnalis TaxID=6523 RepID=A0AAV2IA03_LYMST